MSPGAVIFARVTDRPLDLDEHIGAVADPACGALLTFTGLIRSHDPEAAGEVEAVEYSGHPDAERVLGEIAARAATPEVRLAVSHRTGLVPVGGIAMIACVAAPHRAGAYDVSRELVETIKVDLPVWKRQIEVDGTGSWIGIK